MKENLFSNSSTIRFIKFKLRKRQPCVVVFGYLNLIIRDLSYDFVSFPLRIYPKHVKIVFPRKNKIINLTEATRWEVKTPVTN